MTILVGDCREVLRALPDGSVHTVVTSPPFFGLRDYGTGEWVGGDPACEHRAVGGRGSYAGADGASIYRGEGLLGASNRAHVQGAPHCGGRPTSCRCGAERADKQIGLEASPDEFADALVAVFREVRRVLRPDGTAWLNLGDSYCGSPQGNAGNGTSTLTNPAARAHLAAEAGQHRPNRRMRDWDGIKPKDLIGVPWLVAFALRADGWHLRGDIVWAKPNPMPESVRDRPTRSHEFVFLLTRSNTTRFWTHRDGRGQRVKPDPDWLWVNRETGVEAREPQQGEEWARLNLWRGHDYYYDADAIAEPRVGTRSTDSSNGAQRERNRGGRTDDFTKPNGIDLKHLGGVRNRRDVWTIATRPYKGAHFAVFPTDLAEPCVLAGAPARACGECGAPWARLSRTELDESVPPARSVPEIPEVTLDGQGRNGRDSATFGHYLQRTTLGYTPTCSCDADAVPGVVLDPFAGAGTVGVVCGWHGREFIGIELKQAHADLAHERIAREGKPSGRRLEPAVVSDDQMTLEVG